MGSKYYFAIDWPRLAAFGRVWSRLAKSASSAQHRIASVEDGHLLARSLQDGRQWQPHFSLCSDVLRA